LIQINGDDLALRAYQPRDEHRHITHSAADIEHPHSGRNSSNTKKVVRGRRQYPRLPNQPLVFAICMAKNVI
jgi:hypothetical protein